MVPTLLISISLLLGSLAASALKTNQRAPSCFDDEGKPVDWFIGYKIPVLPNQEYPFNTGFSYAYITSDSMANQNRKKTDSESWTVSEKLLDDPESMLSRTLAAAYTENPNLNSIFYSDQPPKKGDGSMTRHSLNRAHSKGVLLMDDLSGKSIWLVHSVR